MIKETMGESADAVVFFLLLAHCTDRNESVMLDILQTESLRNKSERERDRGRERERERGIERYRERESLSKMTHSADDMVKLQMRQSLKSRGGTNFLSTDLATVRFPPSPSMPPSQGQDKISQIHELHCTPSKNWTTCA